MRTLLFHGDVTPHPAVTAFERQLSAGSTVVDLGCGQGRHSLFLAGRGHDVTAVDVEASAVAKCRALATSYGSRDLRHVVMEGDITGDLFPGRQFDGVICTYVLQDLTADDARAAFKTIERLTKPGGSALVVAYTGSAVQTRIAAKTLLLHGEPTLHFENRRWTVLWQAQRGGPLISSGGRLAPQWGESIVIAQKPGVRAVVPVASSATGTRPSNEELDRLRRSDPEHFEDWYLYGLG